MPVDLHDKALNIASQVASSSATLMKTLRDFVATAERAESSGVDFTGIEFDDTALKYCTGDDIQTAILNAKALLEYLDTNHISGIFDKVTST